MPFGTRVPRSAYIASIRALISAVLIEPLRTAGHEFDLEVRTFIGKALHTLMIEDS